MTCVEHLFHSCAIKVKFHFEDVDQLLANVKSATVKNKITQVLLCQISNSTNKSRQAKFVNIGGPPKPIDTRCGSWLNTSLYYAKNLPAVKAIVEEGFEVSSILVNPANVSFPTTSLGTQHLKIKDQYKCLVKFVETMESAKYTKKEAVQAIFFN